MGKDFYNILEFNKALYFVKRNPFEAKERFEAYLSKYPKDYCAYPYYIFSLIALELYNEAEKVLDYVEMVSVRNKKFMDMEDKLRNYNHNIFICRAKLLSYQERYEELFQLCMDNKKEIVDDYELECLLFYARVRSGRDVLRNREDYSYVYRQILEYREDEFLEHNEKHLMEHCFEDNVSVFVPNFPIREVISEIKEYLLSEKRLCTQYFQDIYVFRYDGCGITSNKSVNYFRVVCFHNTKDIITMYPISERENLPCVDLNYMVKLTEVKVKRRSQIDKFNQRYNNSGNN